MSSSSLAGSSRRVIDLTAGDDFDTTAFTALIQAAVAHNQI